MKQARISLVAEVGGFKKRVEEAKAAIEGIGKAKISPDAEKRLMSIFSNKLKSQASDIEKRISDINKGLERLSTSSGEAFDSNKVAGMTKAADQLKGRLKEVHELQKQIGSGKFPTGAPGAAGGGQEKAGSVLGSMGGGLKKMILGAVAGAGFISSFNRREQMADERLKIRGLTQGGELPNEKSSRGYTRSERRQRAAGLADAAGGIDGKGLSNITDLSETVDRAYGVGQEQSAGFIGATRRAGGGNDGKLMANSIGAAVAVGLTGSRIGEYLQAMQGYMESMSQGINVDGASLNGFAAALGKLPFFKDDPNRIFNAIRSMDTAFKGGDPFQKAQGTRAILQSAPGSSPAATEFRRSMGLFGSISSETQDKLSKHGVDTRAMKVTGGELVSNIFKDIMASTKGMDKNSQLKAFQDRTGMEAGASADIFASLLDGQKSGKGVDYGALTKQLKDVNMDPTQRLAETMGTADGSIKKLTSIIDGVMEDMATKLGDSMTSLGLKIDSLIRALGGDTESVGGAVGTAAVVGAGAAAIGGGALLKGAAKGAGRLAKAGMKGGPKGVGTAIGRMGGKAAGKMIGRVAPFIGLAFAAKDAWDIFEKGQRGEKITPKDWAVLSTSVLAGAAAMIPGFGTGAAIALTAAAAGAELLPDDIGMGGGGDSIPADGIPSVSPTGEMTPGTPSSATGSPGSAGGGGGGAVQENTAALRELTGAIRQKGGGGGMRTPTQAKFLDRSQMAAGK